MLHLYDREIKNTIKNQSSFDIKPLHVLYPKTFTGLPLRISNKNKDKTFPGIDGFILSEDYSKHTKVLEDNLINSDEKCPIEKKLKTKAKNDNNVISNAAQKFKSVKDWMKNMLCVIKKEYTGSDHKTIKLDFSLL